MCVDIYNQIKKGPTQAVAVFYIGLYFWPKLHLVIKNTVCKQ